MGAMKIKIIRVDGSTEQHEVPHAFGCMTRICELIGAKMLDTVNLRDSMVMLVDDGGYETEEVDKGNGVIELRPVRALRPVNPEATKMYWAICVPGTTYQIVGDVAIVRDEDFS